MPHQDHEFLFFMYKSISPRHFWWSEIGTEGLNSKGP